MSKLKQLPSIHKLKIKPIFVLPKPESRSLEWNKKNEVLKLVVNQIMIWIFVWKQKSCETVTVHALAKTMSTQQGTDKTGEKLRLQVSLLWQK